MNTPTDRSKIALARLRAALRKLNDKLRASPLLLLFVIAMIPVLVWNPAKVGLTVYGIAKIGLGGYLGYWVDRIVFPYARPHELEGISQGTAWKRRALIVSAALIAAAFIP